MALPAARLRAPTGAWEREAPHAPPGWEPAQQRVERACAVHLDSDGNVLTSVHQLLAAAVNRLVDAAAAQDAAEPHRRVAPTRLHGCRSPGISIDAYAARLLRYCKCSPVCYVAGRF